MGRVGQTVAGGAIVLAVFVLVGFFVYADRGLDPSTPLTEQTAP